MRRYYLDSSALAKRYRSELGTTFVDRVVESDGDERMISRLVITELCSLLAKCVRQGTLGETEFANVWHLFLADLLQGRFTMLPVEQEHYGRAEVLITTLGLTAGLRSLDALHLAVAMEVHARTPIDLFVTADRKLGGVAVTVGFTVVNPETA